MMLTCEGIRYIMACIPHIQSMTNSIRRTIYSNVGDVPYTIRASIPAARWLTSANLFIILFYSVISTKLLCSLLLAINVVFIYF